MEKLKNYLLNNIETTKDLISEINGYDGSLDFLDYQENCEEFYNIYFYNKGDELARAIYYSSNYNYNDPYIKFNAYGNLETCDEWELEAQIKDYIDEIIDRAIDLYNDNNIDPYDSELKEILDELEG